MVLINSKFPKIISESSKKMHKKKVNILSFCASVKYRDATETNCKNIVYHVPKLCVLEKLHFVTVLIHRPAA